METAEGVTIGEDDHAGKGEALMAQKIISGHPPPPKTPRNTRMVT